MIQINLLMRCITVENTGNIIKLIKFTIPIFRLHFFFKFNIFMLKNTALVINL